MLNEPFNCNPYTSNEQRTEKRPVMAGMTGRLRRGGAAIGGDLNLQTSL